jgi:hypothetical protein
MAGKRPKFPRGSKPKGPAAPPEGIKRESLEKWERERALQAAEVGYITDERTRPLEYWWDQTCSHCIALQRFKERSRVGRWSERRDNYRREVTQEILRQSKYRAVHDRVGELERLQRLRQAAYDAVEPRLNSQGKLIYPVAPKSLEGMITALVRLDVRADDKRDEILSMIDPELLKETADQQGQHFSSEDMRTVARVLLTKRREAQTRRIEADKRLLLTEGGDEDADDE